MKTWPAACKRAYRLREYAVLENEDGTYEYMAWDANPKTGKLGWIRGQAHVVADLLALTKVTDEGQEATLATMKALRKELKKLPDWWDKTKFYGVVLGRHAAMVNYSVTGKPVEKDGDDYEQLRGMLAQHGITLD